MNIYIGNLPFDATEDEIRELFAAFGAVTSVALIKDKFTGQPRGFGFVEMANVGEAQKAIQALNGKDFRNRSMVVNPARPREERSDRGPRTGGGGGFGGGGSSNRRSPGGERRGYQDNRGERKRSW